LHWIQRANQPLQFGGQAFAHTLFYQIAAALESDIKNAFDIFRDMVIGSLGSSLESVRDNVKT